MRDGVCTEEKWQVLGCNEAAVLRPIHSLWNALDDLCKTHRKSAQKFSADAEHGVEKALSEVGFRGRCRRRRVEVGYASLDWLPWHGERSW